MYRKFEYEDYDVRPKRKKIRLPGLPGYVDPATVKKSIAELAHEHLLIPGRQWNDTKDKKNPAAADKAHQHHNRSAMDGSKIGMKPGVPKPINSNPELAPF